MAIRQRDKLSAMGIGWLLALAGASAFCFLFAGPLALFWAFCWWVITGR